MTIRYHLEPNPVKKGGFRAILSRGKKSPVNEFLKYCEANSSVSRIDAAAVLEFMADWIADNARDGREADFGPVGQSRLGIKGDFQEQGDWVEETEIQLTCGWQVSRSLARRVEQTGRESAKERIQQKPKSPEIHSVKSVASNQERVYTPGNILEIRGQYLKFNPKRADEGIFLRRAEEDSEARLEYYQTIFPKKIVALVPSYLSGRQNLFIRSRPRTKGPLREFLFPEVLREG